MKNHKPRWDAPHLEGLRWDYAQLHLAQRQINEREARRPIISFGLFVLGLALWVIGLVALAMLVQP